MRDADPTLGRMLDTEAASYFLSDLFSCSIGKLLGKTKLCQIVQPWKHVNPSSLSSVLSQF